MANQIQFFELTTGSPKILFVDGKVAFDPDCCCDDYSCYECTVCGYVYNESVGDPGNGIPPGTDFYDLPEDWECPVCGVDKTHFFGITCP